MLIWKDQKTEPNLSLYSPYYAEVCNEFAVLISASVCNAV